ncbi:hypothetical protein AAFF_G00117020 [Aldrovandia affinis]|uniref:CCHC-type domain-containing protein n=1 Tax=Aldrovandia affinis TaxID=143900 RepID=A0AAD7WX11_9TELE|nr:hypothetical protein AAFF_G00117020 [Aldrovandia affinis]
MDPADPDQLRFALEQQGAMLGRHQDHLERVTEHLQSLTSGLAELTLTLRAPVINPAPQHAAAPLQPEPSSAPVREPRLPPPERYAGKALYDAFICGLSEHLKDEILTRDLPESFDDLVSLAIRVDSRLQERRRWRSSGGFPGSGRTGVRSPIGAYNHPRAAPSTTPEPEPMQLDRTRLSRQERDRRMANRSCLYCGESGHFISGCPVKANTH